MITSVVSPLLSAASNGDNDLQITGAGPAADEPAETPAEPQPAAGSQ